MQNAIGTISALPVPKSNRFALLGKYAGQQHADYLCDKLEKEITNALRLICEGHQGSGWNYYELSDHSACYMAPGKDEQLNIVVAGNFYSGTMSADAAGIVASLMAFERLGYAWDIPHPIYLRQLQALFKFACKHSESRVILSAFQ